LKLDKIYFCGSDTFLGQSKVSTTNNQICEYGLERDGNISKRTNSIKINCKRIISFDYDIEENLLYLVRERKVEANENFDIYEINLKRNLNP
jgi:hypothetical protein